ncbi:MAG: putative membrane protein [Phormidesmis priestleyi Ana]|uniref:Putative membrane protein n=1 Tax=Phormidesmis priestleyi Ana TaxID=1666911 RepID=A0A0P7ZQ71_9CYAN|nr:MAG: putative membrane protein [Phormidesmis priestleyi Ana]
MDYYIKCITEKYVDFEGRASRSEFWYFVLFNFIAAFVINIIGAILSNVIGVAAYLGALYSLATLVPNIAVAARRLHDTGRSGWWQLIGFIPLVGAIVLLIFFIQDSSFERNQYGPNPKGSGISV